MFQHDDFFRISNQLRDCRKLRWTCRLNLTAPSSNATEAASLFPFGVLTTQFAVQCVFSLPIPFNFQRMKSCFLCMSVITLQVIIPEQYYFLDIVSE